jgi:hypothetical protein
MALQSFRITVGALVDANNGNKNYVSGQAIYIKDSLGVYADIYRDLAGTSQIVQDGVSNVTDGNGQFVFFVEAGDYTAEYNNQITPITVVGSDYFDSRVDDVVNSIQVQTDAVLDQFAIDSQAALSSFDGYADAAKVEIDADVADVQAYTTTGKQTIDTAIAGFSDDADAALAGFAQSSGDAFNQFDVTLEQYKESRGFNNKGAFAAGFTYELPNDVGIDASGNPWIYNGTLPFTVTAGTTPTSPTYTQVTYGAAAQVSTNTSDTVQSFVDSFALKIFQSPTDGGLTEIQTRTVNSGEVYEVRKTSGNSLAIIYSDAAGTSEILQNGTDNKSANDGVIEFYIADGDYYITVNTVRSDFSTSLKAEFDNVDEAISYKGIGSLLGNRVYLKDRQAYFEVVASITITPNDIDQILSTANTSFGFKLPAAAEISTTNLGCTGEQSQSVADRFERGGELINSVGGGTLKINNGRHTIERTTFIPVGVYLKGDSATFNRGTTAEPDFNKSAVLYPLDTGIYIENYLFFLNIDINNPESWVTQFPNKGSGGASNLSIDAATSNVGYNGFKFGGSHKFEELRCRGVGTLIGKPVGLYTDAVSIKQIHASYRKNTTDYLLDIPGLGDAYVIEDIASGYIDNQSGITKNLNLGTCRSGHVTGLINGISTFTNTSGVTISAGHLEGGYYELVNSEVIVSGNVFFTEVDNAQSGVLVNNSDAFLNKWVSVIKDNQFTRVPNRRGGWGNSERADITFANASSMAILENNYRTTSISGEIATKSTFGIIIDMNGNLDNAFNKYSEHLSISKVKVSGGKAHLSHSFGSFNKNYGGFGANSSVVNIDQDSFKEATGTYYYQCQVLLDADRLIGRTVINSEISIDVVSQDDIPVLYLDKSAFEDFSGVKLRVYRGTSSGQYSHYVDLPIVNAGKVYDDGESLSGFPWKVMAVGGMLSLNNNGLSKRFKIFDNNIEIHTDAAKPSAGTWVPGDRVVRDTLTPVLVGDPITTEYLRLSNGSAHAGRVDWLALNMLEA